ncbi:hypothetical protein SUGI_1190680 [Cryptomeria japonica]|uniref:cytochrome P450 716B2 n=1 Tax=Cryptomeria japonica TaxID=3369 RepID=UPI00241481A6|nr:cytochrome P450 716B2 [Cryptomeria japonica]GLJ55451.1 hypothetical protein SUGI_1190680 [Cryptomeria japonica]
MDILVLSASVLGFVLLFYILKSSGSLSKASATLPPGSFGWPVIGEMPEFVASMWANGYQSFLENRNKRYGTIFKTSLFGYPVAVFYSAQGNRFLFNADVQSYFPASAMNLLGNSLISKVGEDARVVRKMLMNFLRPQALQKFVGRADSIVNDHINSKWIEKQQVKAFSLIKGGLFAVACSLFMSVGDEVQQNELHGPFSDILKGIVQIPVDIPGTPYHKGFIARKQAHKLMQKVVDRRRKDLSSGSASPEQDLLSFLLCNVDDRGQKMSDEDIIDNIMMLVVAGHETTLVAVTFLLRYLALHPHCYAQVLQEHLQIITEMEGRQDLEWNDIQKMKYSWRAAQETLRLQPPSLGSLRVCSEDISYDGFVIPKGWKLCWATYSTHKKEEYFPEPEKFDPGRFEGKGPEPYTFVPFGGGRRMCPGNEYARMIILVFLHNIVKSFKWDLVDANEKIFCNPLPLPAQGLPLRLLPLSQQKAV